MKQQTSLSWETRDNAFKPMGVFRVVMKDQGRDEGLTYFATQEEAASWLQAQGKQGAIEERRTEEWALPIDRKVAVVSWVSV
jgi:hypothetical protein